MRETPSGRGIGVQVPAAAWRGERMGVRERGRAKTMGYQRVGQGHRRLVLVAVLAAVLTAAAAVWEFALGSYLLGALMVVCTAVNGYLARFNLIRSKRWARQFPGV
jgi:hypothetical protein